MDGNRPKGLHLQHLEMLWVAAATNQMFGESLLIFQRLWTSAAIIPSKFSMQFQI